MSGRRQYLASSLMLNPGHFVTMNVSPPSCDICVSMKCCIARIVVITTMMEKTPTMMPINVSVERSLWVANELAAMKKLSFSSSTNRPVLCSNLGMVETGQVYFKSTSLIAQRLHRVHARRAPRGQESRHQAGQQRDQHGDSHDRQRHAHGNQKLRDGQRRGVSDDQTHQSAEQTD